MQTDFFDPQTPDPAAPGELPQSYGERLCHAAPYRWVQQQLADPQAARIITPEAMLRSRAAAFVDLLCEVYAAPAPQRDAYARAHQCQDACTAILHHLRLALDWQAEPSRAPSTSHPETD